MIDRDEVAWYYRAGDQTHGPVSWYEIETQETEREAHDPLQVALRSPSDWRSIDSVLATHPELASGADLAAIAEQKRRESREVLTPGDGFAHWLGQAYIIVDSELWSFVAAGMVSFIVSALSFGICAPAMHAGLVRMALDRWERDPVSPLTLREGFEYFREAGKLWLICALAVGAVWGVPSLIYLLAVGQLTTEHTAVTRAFLWGWLILSFLFVGTATFFSMALIVDRRMEAVQAVRRSLQAVDEVALRLFVIQTLLTMMCGVSYLLFFVGGLVNMPLLPAGRVAAYEWFFRDRATGAVSPENNGWSEHDACTAEG